MHIPSNQTWPENSGDQGKKFIWPLPICFISRERDVGSQTNQLINILYALWFSQMLQICFLVHFNLHCSVFDNKEFKICVVMLINLFFSQSKFIIFTNLPSYTITFFEKFICSPLTWNEFFICEYLYIFASVFCSVLWCDSSTSRCANIPTLLFLVNIFLTLLNHFFQMNFTTRSLQAR